MEYEYLKNRDLPVKVGTVKFCYPNKSRPCRSYFANEMRILQNMVEHRSCEQMTWEVSAFKPFLGYMKTQEFGIIGN